MTFTQCMAVPIEVAIGCVGLAVHVAAQEPPLLQGTDTQPAGVALKRVPVAGIDSTDGVAIRRMPGAAEVRERLRAKAVAGGAYTYLSSEPGKYVRVTRLTERAAYVERVDLELGSVTWLGELRVVAGGRRTR